MQKPAKRMNLDVVETNSFRDPRSRKWNSSISWIGTLSNLIIKYERFDIFVRLQKSWKDTPTIDVPYNFNSDVRLRLVIECLHDLTEISSS